MRKLIFPFVLLLTLFAACKKDSFTEEGNVDREIVGRFDNSSFKWDYESNPSSTRIFVGDLSLKTIISKEQRGSTSGILIGSNADIYPGGVYPKFRIDDFSFQNEYPYEKNLFDYYFLFNRKFIVENIFHEYGRGLKEYNTAKNEAWESPQFKDFISSTASGQVDFNSVEAITYSDIEKYFAANASFGKIFTSQMSQNRKSNAYKSIYFARLESSIFQVIFEPDYRDFFLDSSINDELRTANFSFTSSLATSSRDDNSNNSSGLIHFKNGAPYYVRNMSYGSFAYLAIESEYSFSEVKKAIEETFNIWKINSRAKYDQKTVDILSKSSVTLMITAKTQDPSNGIPTHWATSLDRLIDLFNVRYNENYIGTPTFVEVRDVLTNSNYIPVAPTSTESNGGGDRTGGGSRNIRSSL